MNHHPQQHESIPQAVLPALTTVSDRGITDMERAALERLIEHAKGGSGQSRRVADFLLSWWNAGSCGGFDLTTLWGMDDAISADMVTVFAFILRVSKYPDNLGYEADFKAIVREWRPELTD